MMGFEAVPRQCGDAARIDAEGVLHTGSAAPVADGVTIALGRTDG